MEISNESFVVRLIAFFKLSTMLIKDFHYAEGEFDDGSYKAHHIKKSSYYVRNEDSFSIDFNVYNPILFETFILSMLRNIANFLISITFFPLFITYYATRGIVLQFKYLSAELNSSNRVEFAQQLEFNGYLHMAISFVFSPIVFFLNCFFIEPLERYLFSYLYVLIFQMIFFSKLLPYIMLIVLCPIFIPCILLWKFLKMCIYSIQSLNNAVFKKIKVV